MMMMIPVIIVALTKLSCFSMTENTISAMTILKLSRTWPKILPELLFMAFYNVLVNNIK